MPTENEPLRPETGRTTTDAGILKPAAGSRGRGEDTYKEHSVFVNVLTKDRWFALAFVIMILVVVSLVLTLPRIWVVSPSHMPVVIRVSGLDYLQSRALRSTGMKEMEQGRYEVAFRAFESAVANNAVDIQSLRGMLRAVLHWPEPPRSLAVHAANNSMWLLAVTKTNRDDLDLAAQALGHLEEDNYLQVLTLPSRRDLSLQAFASVAESFFRIGQPAQFEALWQERSKELRADPVASLYQAAWLSGWGSAMTYAEGRRGLAAGLQSTNTSMAKLAHRLSLAVASVELNPGDYRRNLDWLAQNHSDRVSEHVGLWRLLEAVGRRDEAVTLAKRFARPPETARELITLCNALAELDMRQVAIERIDQERARFGYDVSVWTMLARLHIAQKDWEQLGELALTIRNDPTLSTQLDGYSRFLTGLSDYHLERRQSAEAEFKEAAHGNFGEPSLAFSTAGELRELGFPGLAADMLKQVQSSFTNRLDFWFQLTVAAHATHNIPMMTEAATEAFRLAPDNPSVVNNYAAMLLITRRDPQEAVRLTLRLLAHDAQNGDLAINHALALLQNGRLEEAVSILKQFDAENMPGQQAAAVRIGWAEYFLRRGDAAKAREEFRKVNAGLLQPIQKEWFDAELQKLENRAKS